MSHDTTHAAAGPYTVQWWAGECLIGECAAYTYRKAVQLAQKATPEFTGRLMCDCCDYTEVFTPSGEHRSGPFALTTRVHVPREGSQP